MIDNTRAIGTEGENEAIDYLKNKGYQIIQTNFNFGKLGEIDIIAKDGKTLVFVEVKFRQNDKFGSPEFSITPSKIKNLRKAAEGYLYINKITNTDCRFDFVGITKENNKSIFNHLINAF